MIDYELLNKLYPQLAKAKTLMKELQEPLQSIKPVVTQADAQNGYIMRYFVRPTNDKSYIVETDKVNYESLKSNPRFITCAIKWKIVGPKESSKTSYGAASLGVRDYNLKAVSLADLTFGGLTSYIRDYTEYWIAEE